MASSIALGAVQPALPLTAEEEGRQKLRNFKLLGFIGSGTFAEVSKYVRLVDSVRYGRNPRSSRHAAGRPSPCQPPVQCLAALSPRLRRRVCCTRAPHAAQVG
jgi:hypothetical protein